MKKLAIGLLCIVVLLVFIACSELEHFTDEEAFEIEMPKYASEYCGQYKSPSAVIEELESLGFTNITQKKWEPGSSSHWSTGVYSVEIYKGWSDGFVSFRPGDTFKSNAEIEITYFDYSSMIVAEEGSELYNDLHDENISIQDFVKKYQGEIICFDGYITGTVNEITGKTVEYVLTGAEYNEDLIDGLIFSTDVDYDWNVSPIFDSGDRVKVIGKVNGAKKDSTQVGYIVAYYIQEVDDPMSFLD